MNASLQTFKRMVFRLLIPGLISLFAGNLSVKAQALTGTKNIPGSYGSIAAAVADLNTNGVGTGGVTFNISAGYSELITAPISVTATGTAANPIIFQKSGAGANPLITAYVGTNTPASTTQDGMWNLIGSDYVTIDGIDLTDPNTTNPATMEYGFALYKASLSNGAQNNTIKNCVITLSTVNNVAGSGPAVDGSRGIDVVNATVAAATTALSPTAIAGTNSSNGFFSNTIKNCNIGISIIGYAAPSPFTAADNLNDIGGSSLATGNTILNFGGAASAANPAAGIRTLAQYGINVSYNTINNNDGAGVNHPNTLRGIYLNTATSASGNCNNNTVTIKGGGTTQTLYAIDIEFGATAASNTVNVNNNIIENCSYSTATTGAFYGIYAPVTPTNLSFRKNIIRNNTTNGSTGVLYGINWTSPTNLYVDSNQVYNLTRAGAGTLYGIYSGSSSTNEYITNNEVHDLSSTATTSSTVSIRAIYQTTAAGIKEYKKNTIYNLSITGSTATDNTIEGLRVGYGTTIDMSGNVIYGISGVANTIVGLGASGTTTGAVYKIYNNKIYDLSSSITGAPLISGIVSAAQTHNIYNNIIGDLRAASANGADVIRGINFTSTTATTTNNVYYNTVYLNATSSGTNFGTAGIYHTVSTTATTATLNLRNNIIVNNSTPAGTGFTAAFRRSGIALDNYATTSNNNLFYAGTPGVSSVIFNDGTNRDQTLGAFKIRMATRDQASISENPSWVSTTGANAGFLNINTATPSQVESKGVNISTYTTDFGGNTRQGNPGYPAQSNGGGTAPDLGAWEFDGIPASPPVISGISFTPGVQCVGTSHNVSATVTNSSGSLTSVVVNYSINGVAQTALTMTNTSGNTWATTIPAASPSNATVTWSITATNSLPLSTVSSVSTYGDEPLNGALTAVVASVSPSCSGAPVQLSAVVAKAGGTAAVGAGATTSADYPNPFYSAWSNTHNQYLITAAELRAGGLFAGNITSLGIQITVTNLAMNDLSIKMAHTTATNMSAFLAPTFTNVFSAAVYTPVVGVNTMNFSAPFNWDGVSNIVIEICHGNSGSTSTMSSTVVADATPYVSTIHTHKSAATAASAVCIDLTTNLNTYSTRPKFIFGGVANIPLSSYSWSDGFSTIGSTNPITVSPVTATNYTFTATDANGCSISLGTPYQHTVISTSLSGTINVGAGQTYTTLTSAINAYNNVCTLSGPVTFLLIDASYSASETFPLVINNHPQASATNTLTIKPAPGTTVAISGSSATSLINLNAAKYVTIDGSNNGSNSRNLSISNTSTGTSSAVIWAQNTTGGDSVTHNTISNVIVSGNSNTTTLFGIGIGGTSIGTSSLGNKNNSNVIKNCKVSKVQYGIYSTGASVAVKNQNTVIDSNELNAAAPDNIQYRGILVGFENNIRITNNKVGNITTSSGTVMGISLGVTSTNTYAPTGNEVTNAVVNKNVVGPVITAGGNTAFGIAVPAVTSGTNTFTNNSVFSVRSNATPSDFCAGIYIGGGAGSSTKLYFNSVSLTDAATRSTPSAYAIAIGGTDPVVELKNNVFYNTQTTSGVGNSYAIGYASSAFTNMVSDYNLYYTAGANAQFAVTGAIGINTAGTTRTTLALLRTATGKDANSISVDPSFASTTNLTPGLGVSFLGAGVAIPGITSDIIDSLRGNPPSIGAYEKGADLTGPSITYTALPNDFNPPGSRVVTAFATVTDVSGINVTSGTKPRIYYKKKGNANAFVGNTFADNGWKWVEASNTTSPFDFVIDYGLILGGFVSNLDTIQYFVVAQDNAAYPNVGANPSAGFSATNVGTITSAPTTVNQYIVVNQPPLSGSYDIGAGLTSPNYATITAALSDLSLRGVSSAVVFNLVDAKYTTAETFPLVLPSFGGASAVNTVTIKPGPINAVTLISGSATTAIFKFANKAQYYVIDGSNNGTNSRNLMISNTSTATSSVVWFEGLNAAEGVKRVVFKNALIKGGSNAATLGVLVGGATIGLSSNGMGTDSIFITNNNIYNCYYPIVVSGSSSSNKIQNIDISKNDIGTDSSSLINQYYGVYTTNANRINVHHNHIFNQRTTSSLNIAAIQIMDNTTNSSFSNNRIHGLSSTSSGGYGAFGINVGSNTGVDNDSIMNNIIYDLLTYNYSSTSTLYNAFGIRLDGGLNLKIYYNTVNLYGQPTGGTSASASAALLILSNTYTGVDIRNNMFVNSMTGAISGSKHYSFWTTLAAPVASVIFNYNNFFASGIHGVLMNGNGTDITTLAALRTATGANANSININPAFSVPTNLTPTLGTPISGGGVSIPGVTKDFIDSLRGNPPSIGAYENGVDLAGPTINYTALPNDVNPSGSRTVSAFATITDYTGVNVTSGTKPRIYYKKKGDANAFAGNTPSDNGWKWVEATNSVSPFDFVIDYSLILGGFVSHLDSIQYFVVAQDNVTTPNVGANPSAGFSGTGVGTITSAPTTVNQYLIVNLPALSGSYNIGAGLTAPNYTTITAALSDLTLRGASSAVVFNLVDATYGSAETFPITVTPFSGANATNTLTIKPASGTNVTISGSSTATSVINLNAAKYVILDGSNNGTSSRNLTVSNTNTSTSSAVIWAQNSTGGDSATHNTIRNVIVSGNSNTTTLIGIGVGGTTISNSSLGTNNNSNVIRNCKVSKVQYGIYSAGASATIKNQNNVIDSNELNVDAPDNIQYRGILVGFENNIRISNNKVGNITTTGTVMGISLGVTSTNTYTPTGNEVSNALVTKNIVGPVIATGGTTAFGIAVPAVTSGVNTFTNNVVFSIMSGATPSDFCAGIYIGGGAGSSTKLYFNSVSLTGSATRSTPSAYAIAIGGADPVVEMKNNIFYNVQTTTGVGNSYAIGYASSTFANLVSDYNLYYTSGANAQFAVTGGIGINTAGTIQSTLAALKTATGKDANSINTDPSFVSSVNLIPGLGTALLGGGVSIPGITTDITGSLRGNPPSMGAYESGVDLAGPAINYAALANHFNPSGTRVLNSFATITDYSGVNVTSGTKPRIYYKKKGNANVFVGNTSADNGWKWVEATNSTSPFSFVIDYSLILGGSVSNLDTVQYFVVAQDNVGTPNVNANPSLGFSATSVNAIASAPANANQYIIVNLPPLSGSYNIGAGLTSPNYATITAAFNDLSLRGASSAVVFNLVDATYSSAETFPLTISQFTGSSAINTVTIKPASGNTATITGSSTTSVINLNAAKYVIIDGSNNGGNSRNLTVSNTNTDASSAVIWVQNSTGGDSATHNTISNMIVSGNSNTTTLFGIGIGGTTIGTSSTGTNNNSNVIRNCKVSKVQNGIYSSGSFATRNQNTIIDSNELNVAAPDNIQLRGILVGLENNIRITNNKVGNITSSSTVMGISLGVTSTNTYIPTGNEVTNAMVTKNVVGPIISTGNTTAFGIAVPAVTSGTNTFTNNSVFSVMSNATPSDFCAGIYIGGGTGSSTKVYYNSVSLTGSATRSSPNAYAIAIGGTDPVIELKNNIFYNTQTTSGVGNSYAIGYASSAFTNLVSNYNLYYTSGANAQFAVTGGIGANTVGNIQATLAALKTATGKDANSKSLIVNFVSATDLHLTGTSNGDVNLIATPITGITTDIDGNTRSTQYPYMGSDEASNPLPVKLTTLTAVAKGADVLVSWATASEINNKGFDVERSVDGNTFVKVGFVKGAGNSSRLISYNLNDANAFKATGTNTLYYRLKQTDFDGKQAISDVVIVTSTESGATAEPVVYPNPFGSRLQVQLFAASNSTVQINIFDLSGRALVSKQAELSEGLNAVEIDKLADLNAGVYFVSIIQNGITTVKKVIKN